MLRQHGSLFVVLTASLVLAPFPARAQGLGVVTTLTGTATLARASQSQPLRFRDTVFEQDKIATAEKSLVRVLLGGKAIVTIRELSELTITEGHRKSIIHLSSGKIGLAVARPLGSGSTLTLLAGPLVSLSGGSVLKVSGALVVFTGTGGSVLSVSNSLCGGPCALIGGIPVAFTGGATAANVVIGGEPVRNSILGTIKLASPSTALIAVDGKNTKVAVVGK